MNRWIKKCKFCDIYTLKELCPKCKRKTTDINPPNVGLEDPYQKYRIKRRLKELNLNCEIK
ncbi:MAG TPA: ribosome biogenesis protein [Nautiliaceae bacterium]|nr:ribosome biogenesis protein [Nautiliaceae bacterium]